MKQERIHGKRDSEGEKMFRKSFLIIVIFGLLLTACTINGVSINIPGDRITGSGDLQTETRAVAGFTRVDLQSIGNLTITQGNEESLTVTADDNLLAYITTRVVNGTLEISTRPNVSIDPSRTIEYHLVMKSVEGVQLSGFGNINSEGLKGTDLEVKLSGSGDISIGSIECNSLLVRISGFGNFFSQSVKAKNPVIEITGSGDITVEDMQAEDVSVKISGFGDAVISGRTIHQSAQILGSGDYKAGDLESESAAVKITGFGNARIWASETLDVTITGSGSVEYYGSPRLTQTMTGFGKVNSIGEH
jgi:hypothetical protein